jgi:hypothetical protein
MSGRHSTVPLGRRKEACKHLEHRGLTGTVRANESHRGSALKSDVDFLKRRAVVPNDRDLLQGQCQSSIHDENYSRSITIVE